MYAVTLLPNTWIPQSYIKSPRCTNIRIFGHLMVESHPVSKCSERVKRTSVVRMWFHDKESIRYNLTPCCLNVRILGHHAVKGDIISYPFMLIIGASVLLSCSFNLVITNTCTAYIKAWATVPPYIFSIPVNSDLHFIWSLINKITIQQITLYWYRTSHKQSVSLIYFFPSRKG